MTTTQLNINSTIEFASFTNDHYHKSQVLPELLKLESELVEFTIPQSLEGNKNYKLYDVENYLENLNAERNYIASKELALFKEGCKNICNKIKAEISGQKGEDKAFSYLSNLNCSNILLRNIELSNDNNRTELDAIVITPKRVFIIEVKNTSRDIFIDKEGNYYRTGKYLNWDSNILQKMDIKEELLRGVLSNCSLDDISIERIVVFTNNRVRVTNECASIKTTFVSQLPSIIARSFGCTKYSSADMDKISQTILENKCQETYPLDFDIVEFKNNYISLMSKLSSDSSKGFIGKFKSFLSKIKISFSNPANNTYLAAH